MSKKDKKYKCIACGEYECQKKGGWNFRIVAVFNTQIPKCPIWDFQIREVHYSEDNHKISGWSAEPSYLSSDVDPQDLYEETVLIQRAFTRPILIEKEEKLITYSRSAMFVKPEMLKEYEQ